MKDYHIERDDSAQPPEPQGEQAPDRERDAVEAEALEHLERLEAEEESRESDPEEEDAVQWDGSEAQLVADEDAAEYEEQQTGVQLSYILTEQELLEALKTSGNTKARKNRTALYSILLAVLFIVFAALYFLQGNDQTFLFMMGADVLAFAIVLVSFVFGYHSRAKSLANGKPV